MNIEKQRLQEKFYNCCDQMAEGYYYLHRRLFQNYTVDVDDLKQELSIAVLETINKFSDRPDDEIQKLVVQSAFWKLRYIKREALTHMRMNERLKSEYELFRKKLEPFLKLMKAVEKTSLEKGTTKYKDANILENFGWTMEDPITKIEYTDIMSYIRDILNDQEYIALHHYYIEGCSLKECCKYLHCCTRERVRQILDNALRKVRNKFKKDLTI